jgi:uncharacterized membrane protein
VSDRSESDATVLRTSRLEAFSDGVMAIILTIMVLEIRPPAHPTIDSLRHSTPDVLAYTLSFVYIAIYWNNHHHLFRATREISAGIMWANMHLLFWLSLVPAVTAWVGEAPRSALPAAVYGIVACMAGLAYFLLVRTIISVNDRLGIARALSNDRKGVASVVIYATGAALAFVQPWLAYLAYALVTVGWLVPDRRLEVIEAEE